jgi:signal transduction histidine kinase/HD-GYP domain-containing protein (c-di-GMP phosphodiesterase class II)
MPEAHAYWSLYAARWADVLTLTGTTGTLFSGYVYWASLSHAAARRNREEMHVAQSELAKLNKIAKDIYEDSNDLMIKQKEQALAAMKRADGLESLLEMGIALQMRRNLDDALQLIVNMINKNVGFKTVTMRILNEDTQSFETRAHVGVTPDQKEKIVSYRIPMSEFEKMIDPRSRISNSYFIKSDNPWYGEKLSEDAAVLTASSWNDIEMLVVPLLNEEEKIIGYMTAENIEKPNQGLSDVIELLEHVSAMAVVGVRNARIFEELKKKDEKLKDFTEKLTSLNKMKSNFVATISHEFRTPLTSIKAYCDTLIKNADSVNKELLKEFLFVIDEESGRLMTLVEDILDFSQIESGAMNFERRPCNLNNIVSAATTELARNFQLKDVALHQELPRVNLVIHAERDLIKQLVVNLLHNASKFSKPGGNVWVRVEEEVAAARIIVEDDGIGIPEDQLEKVFDQFYQVDNTSTREHGGTGLGLALCRSIVDWHDGRIWVQNITDGGARFVAVIPKKQVVVRSHVMNVASAVRRFEVEKFLELIVENVAELMGASKVSLMLLDRLTGELRIEGAIGMQKEVVEHARVKPGEGISGKVAAEGRPMLVEDIERDERVARSNNEPVYGSKSFITVPIIGNLEVLGVVNVSSPVGRPTFNERDLELLVLFAERLAIALDKLKAFTGASAVYEEARETFQAILEAKRFVETRDNNLIVKIVARTARKLGLKDETVVALPYILNVYDLGLASISSHILKKPKELSPQDREEIETHTIVGNELLKAIEPGSKVRDIVLYHHENYDGTGYPGRLKGESIPIESRIVRIADSLKALISERPYQRKYTFDEAVEILKHRSGSFFDPTIVGAFIESMNECAPGVIVERSRPYAGPKTAGDEPEAKKSSASNAPEPA